MQLSKISSVSNISSRTTKTNPLFIRIISNETISRLINRKHLVSFHPQCLPRTFQICIYFPVLYDEPWLIFKVAESKIDGRSDASPRYLSFFMLSFCVSACILLFFLPNISMKRANDYYTDYVMEILNQSPIIRRNETICCLIGFGIGVGCCILYRFLSNFLTSSNDSNATDLLQHAVNHKKYSMETKPLPSVNSSITQSKRERLHDDYIPEELTWSEMSSSLSTLNLLHDSYHSHSLTGDSGVDCPEMPHRNHPYASGGDDDEQEILLKKYDVDTKIHHDTQTAAESHIMSHISTEKGLERALEQTSRFYTDLEHIATDLGALSKRYSQSETSLSHRSIDALDWDWHDDLHSPSVQSPKSVQKKAQLNRSLNKTKIRRRLNPHLNQTEYHESDYEKKYSLDCSTSPVRRKHSSVYFDSTDNTSDEDNFGDETLQLN